MARTFPRPDFFEEGLISKWLYQNRRQYRHMRKEPERETITHELEAQRMYFEELVPAQHERYLLE
ncbi:hypothetical protein EXS73_02815 [Candidatus Pacearchaeota archaeon]|nr:hypothetical protein [Candidatus Pacearchaeota archaeon]